MSALYPDEGIVCPKCGAGHEHEYCVGGALIRALTGEEEEERE